MDHAAGVGIGHRLADLLEDRQESGQVVVRRRMETLVRRAARAPRDLSPDGAGPYRRYPHGRQLSRKSAARVRPLTSFMAKKGRRSGNVPSS